MVSYRDNICSYYLVDVPFANFEALTKVYVFVYLESTDIPS